jgi:hypothetical protein
MVFRDTYKWNFVNLKKVPESSGLWHFFQIFYSNAGFSAISGFFHPLLCRAM